MGLPSYLEDIRERRDAIQNQLSGLEPTTAASDLSVPATKAAVAAILQQLDAIIDLISAPEAETATRAVNAEASVVRLEAQIAGLERTKEIIGRRLGRSQAEAAKERDLLHAELASLRSRFDEQKRKAAAKITKAKAEAADARRVRRLLSKPTPSRPRPARRRKK